MLPEPIQAALRVIRVFDQLGIPYFLGGSLASILHGIVRATQDVDIIADIRLAHIPDLVAGLEKEFYIDEVMVEQAVLHLNSFNILHRESFFKVDVFISKDRPFDRSQFQRAKQRLLMDGEEVEARIAAAEDILLAKLDWYRQGGEKSERHWRDVLGIAKIQADALDLKYLHFWAQELGVSDLLEKVLREI